MLVLAKAITAKFNSVKTAGTIWYDTGGQMYYIIASELTATYPYIVFHIISDVPGWNFTQKTENIRVQFSIFCQTDATDMDTYYNHLISLYDFCTLTVDSPWRSLTMERLNSLMIFENIDIYHKVVDYRVLLEK
jgi:hypothetical protein